MTRAPSLGILLLLIFSIFASGQKKMVIRQTFQEPEDQLPAGWRPITGSWSVEKGALLFSGQEGVITFGEASWQNYEIEVTATFLEVKNRSRWVAVLFRCARDGSAPWSQVPLRFRSTLHNGVEFAVRKAGGRWSVRKRARAAEDSTRGKPRKIRVLVQGSHVQGFIDGDLVIDSFTCLDRARGCVGLGASGCKARFDDFTVRLLPDSPPGKASDRVGDCKIVAHRGWSAKAPENTLAALALAAGAGADGSEFDVRLSRDGVIVLMHDRTVDRTTDGRGKVADLTLAQLRKLDAGSWKDSRYAGEPVPTLEEALKKLRGSGCMPVVEIKVEGISRRVVNAIKAAGMEKKSAVIAFSPTVVKEMRTLAPAVSCAWLLGKTISGTASQRVDWIVREAGKCRTRLVNLNYDMLSPEIISALHDRGFTVWTWTVNDPVVMRALLQWGVDAITTDRVDVLREVKRRLLR